MTTEPDELLPPYDGIKMTDVRMVKSDKDAADALAALFGMDVIGFDTESKPTFIKGEVSTGPHLVQLANDQQAFLFQIGTAPAVQVLRRYWNRRPSSKWALAWPTTSSACASSSGSTPTMCSTWPPR